MPEIPMPPKSDDEQANIEAAYAALEPTLQSSTLPEAIPLTHQDTGAAGIFPPPIEIRRGEGNEKFPPLVKDVEFFTAKIEEINQVYDLFPILSELNTSRADGYVTPEYFDQLKVTLADKMTGILVNAAKSSSMDSDLIRFEMKKLISYSFLSPEQRKQVEDAIQARSEFNLATATLDEINERYRSGKFSLQDIQKITDPAYLMLVAESVSSQLKGGSGDLAHGVSLVRAIADRIEELQNPTIAAMRRMMKTMDGFIKFT